MKNYTSKFLKSVAIFYLGFPVFYIVVSALLFDVPASRCLGILLSPGYYLLSIFAILVGYALWEMKRWSWYGFVTVNILVVYENAVIASEVGETHHKLAAFFFSVFLLLLMGYRVSKEIRVPYFFPKIRWWESNPRYRLTAPVRLTKKGGAAMDGQILDLSLTGCFIKLRGDLQQHDAVDLAFTLFGFLVECQGVVVWRTQSTVTHPKGVGVKFLPLLRPQRRALRQIVQRLRKIARLYRRSRYLLNPEEFLRRLQEIETKGPGRRRREGLKIS
ncbi:MAG: PilZ domain-containing protein [Oligoflexia bacterium]|nr:PilZ domain-containing protein [Oligoflexia bacterium]